MKGRHFLSLDSFSKNDLLQILTTAARLKKLQANGVEHHLLRGKCLAMIFQQPSNRTRISFEVGMYQLGGKALNVRPSEIKMGKREPIADIARVMARYVNAVMMRVSKHSDITEFAENSSVPVINGLSDLYHPCQTISDMMTIWEKKGGDLDNPFKGLKLCYIGDGNNVCNSLIHSCRILEIPLIVCCPKGYEPILESSEWCYELITSPKEAVSGVDVIYTDVWTSMGQEEETERRLKKFKNYTVTPELMSLANKDAIFMHCLPAHRGEEVVHEVVESKQSVVFDQAENRLHVQKAILSLLLED